MPKPRKANPGSSMAQHRWMRWAATTPGMCLIVSVFSVLIYINTLGNDFVWDDRTLVAENANLRTLDWSTVERAFTTHYWEVKGRPGGLYRPLSTLSFYLDYQLYGNNPSGYHLTNVLLNASVCVLAFLLILVLFGSASIALIAALLFASLPLHTENVAWVAGRTDLIATLFMLISLLCYVWWRRKGVIVGLGLSIVAFITAVLAKEFALVLPPIVLVLEIAPFARLARFARLRSDSARSRVRALLTPAVFFGVAALFFVVRKAVLGASVLSFKPFATGFADTAALGLSILAHYLYKLLFPFLLNAESEFPVPDSFFNLHTMVGAAMVALIFYGVYRWRRRGEVVFGAVVFCIGLAPVLNVIPITEVSAERFLYFPSLGFVLVVATLLVAWMRRQPTVAAAAVVLVLASFAVRTYTRNLVWRDEGTLFSSTVAAAEDNARAHLNLGNSHYRAHRRQEALLEYRKALEIDPNYANAWSGSAGVYMEMGNLDEAFRCMQRALNSDPNNSAYHNSMAILLVQQERYAEAIESLRHALRLNPNDARARFNLALAMFKLDDYEGAIRTFSEVPYKDVEYVHAYYYLAAAEWQMGHTGRAAEHAATFLKLYGRDDELSAGARQMLSGRSP